MKKNAAVIYRYLPAQWALEALQTNQFRVAYLNNLNDIFDCAPRIINRTNMSDKGYENRTQNRIYQNHGILSFSAKRDNLLVWAHYAKDYTGIAIGLKTSSLENHFGSKDLWRVEYDKKGVRPSINFTGHAVSDVKIYRAYGTKGDEWRYEEEYRLFLKLREQCHPQGDSFFVDIPKNSLTEVILGPRCKIRHSLVRESAKIHFGNTFNILQSKKSETHFKLIFD